MICYGKMPKTWFVMVKCQRHDLLFGKMPKTWFVMVKCQKQDFLG